MKELQRFGKTIGIFGLRWYLKKNGDYLIEKDYHHLGCLGCVLSWKFIYLSLWNNIVICECSFSFDLTWFVERMIMISPWIITLVWCAWVAIWMEVESYWFGISIGSELLDSYAKVFGIPLVNLGYPWSLYNINYGIVVWQGIATLKELHSTYNFEWLALLYIVFWKSPIFSVEVKTMRGFYILMRWYINFSSRKRYMWSIEAIW